MPTHCHHTSLIIVVVIDAAECVCYRSPGSGIWKSAGSTGRNTSVELIMFPPLGTVTVKMIKCVVALWTTFVSCEVVT